MKARGLALGLRIASGVLLTLHLTAGVAAIAVLGRMRPAIERVIDENVSSLEAVEQMLVVLTEAHGSDISGSPAADRFMAAFARASSRITDERERPLIAGIGDDAEVALGGDLASIVRVSERLVALGEVNREHLRVADVEVQRLGNAGAWAVVFLAVLTLLGGIVAVRRFDRLALRPLEELLEVLVAADAGHTLRRCGPANGASSEIGAAMAALNHLLDVRGQGRPTAAPRADDTLRAALLALLDQRTSPTAVVDRRGVVMAASRSALAVLASESVDLRAAVEHTIDGNEGAARPLVEVERVGDDVYLCVLSPASPRVDEPTD